MDTKRQGAVHAGVKLDTAHMASDEVRVSLAAQIAGGRPGRSGKRIGKATS